MAVSFRKRMALASAWLLAVASAPACAQDPQRFSAGGLEIYYGLLPSELVTENEFEHGDGRGAPASYHLVIALFNAATGERITDAAVRASVGPLGLAPETRRLDPMTINQTVTFGNYFPMPGPGPYHITVRIRLPGGHEWIEGAFEYRHP